MNPAACVSKVLESITENIDSIEENQSFYSMIDSVCEIGCYALRKSLPCHILKNVFLLLKKAPIQMNLTCGPTSKFFLEVNQYFQTGNLSPGLKLVLLSYYTPAVEAEVLNLLNRCSAIRKTEELPSLKTAVSTSLLPSACVENQDMFCKVNCILKETFKVSGRHPAVGYLSFVFNQAIKNCNDASNSLRLFNNELSHLEIMLSIPQHHLVQQEQEFYLKQILSTLVQAVDKNLCDETDIAFFCAVLPSIYHQALSNFSRNNSCFDVYQFMKIVFGTKCDLRIKKILKNPIWGQLLHSL